MGSRHPAMIYQLSILVPSLCLAAAVQSDGEGAMRNLESSQVQLEERLSGITKELEKNLQQMQMPGRKKRQAPAENDTKAKPKKKSRSKEGAPSPLYPTFEFEQFLKVVTGLTRFTEKYEKMQMDFQKYAADMAVKLANANKNDNESNNEANEEPEETGEQGGPDEPGTTEEQNDLGEAVEVELNKQGEAEEQGEQGAPDEQGEAKEPEGANGPGEEGEPTEAGEPGEPEESNTPGDAEEQGEPKETEEPEEPTEPGTEDETGGETADGETPEGD